MRTEQIKFLTLCGLLAIFLPAQLSWAQDESHVVVIRPTERAFVPPLNQFAPVAPQSGRLSSPPDDDDDLLRMHGPRGTSLVQDSVLQRSSGESTLSAVTSFSTPGLNILGLGTGFAGVRGTGNVPDTNGAAGGTQFVQFINDVYAVFNKSNGDVLLGPQHPNVNVFNGLSECGVTANLDEVIQFDKLANVWVLLMPYFSTPGYLCVAVSATSDATGSWYAYQYEAPVNTKLCNCRMMTDYPKLAVWPDAYYISFNLAWSNNYEGPAVCAIDRSQLLINGPAPVMQCWLNTGSTNGSLLPADLDGTTPPPAGSPEYYLSLNENGAYNSLSLWQSKVTWQNPNTMAGVNSFTFTGPTNIPVAGFTEACGETLVEIQYTTGDCIPQAGTSQTLDSYGDRLMYRLAYRNFGAYQALVANHAVTIGTSSNQTGIRWYELTNTGAGFGLYQQGTYAPDSNYRWMGSIAMDQLGDIALGYSVSSATMSPSIRYTGRTPNDPLGQMEGEIDVLSAAGISPGSRTNNYRWADYSSLAIDPTDDCTFWYTTEYMPANGGNWSTRIASFSFPACTSSVTLTVNEVGRGTVTSTDGSINCTTNGGGGCSAVYASGSSVTLNATPATGSTFSGWSGSCTGGNPCNLVMNSNLTATANFTTVVTNYTLTVNETGQGTVTSTDGAINCTNGSGNCSAVYSGGSSVTLNAAPATGSTFTGWSGSCSGGNPCSLTMNSNQTATATFVTTPSWAIVHKASIAGSITSLTIPATGSGNLIAVTLMFNGTTSVASISDNAGNTYVSAGAMCVRGNNTSEIWYAMNSNSGATVITPTFVGSPTSVEITSWEVSGVLALAPDAESTASGTVTLSNTPGAAVTTTQVGDFIVSVLLGLNASFTGISSGNAFTNDFKTFGNGWAHITSNSTAAGTYQASWVTSPVQGGYCSSTVAFFP